ncbi:MAG: DUF962 domain-containing protein [Candidatus Xenobia bacterium]
MLKHTLAEYMDLYEEEHSKPLTRLTHMVGIPMIVASLPMFFKNWRIGAALFAGGWAFQLMGHRIQGNKPLLLDDPVYTLVGPVWVAREIAEGVGLVLQDAARGAQDLLAEVTEGLELEG